MNVFSRSWEITKSTFEVMKKEKELFLFPILSIIFSLIFSISLLFPKIILYFFRGDAIVWSTLDFFLLFINYLGLVFIATFFNVCVVYTSANAFSNKESKFTKTIRFAFSKFHIIFFWSLLAATISLFLKIIERIAEKIKGIGGILLLITGAIFGLAWNVATIFVIPSLVYRGLGPIDSIKNSVGVLKKTWGETLIKYLGMGYTFFLIFLSGTSLFLLIGFLFSKISPFLVLFVLLGFFLFVFLLLLFFSVANNIFNTALYVYAETGIVPEAYSEFVMKNAFKKKKCLFKKSSSL